MPDPVSHGRPQRLLAIAGSDSSGGAGIQADIKTATALGAYAMTAVTAVTAQDTLGVHAVELMPPALVAAQIRACLEDIGADAIKVGMLGSGEIAGAVAEALDRYAANIPIVLDPILGSTSGTSFLDETGIQILREQLIPLATLVTPNLPEWGRLVASTRSGKETFATNADWLDALGAKALLIKGGHEEGDEVLDMLVTPDTMQILTMPRLDTPHTHGTGCTLSTAIAFWLACGLPLPAAVSHAREFVQSAIETAPGFGKGHGPLNHMHGRG
jgi:hydroxymethylpyrimidine/phosphomethylpyrimidine kinase